MNRFTSSFRFPALPAILAISLLISAIPASAQDNKNVPVTPNNQTNNQSINSTVGPAELRADPPRGTDTATVSAMPMQSADRTDIKIGIGDLIAIKVYGVTEMSDEVRVNGSGDISLALLGNVHVEGLTSEQIERTLEKRLVDGGFVNDPHVSIFVKEYVTQGVSMMGEVTKPGIYPMIGARRLFDAISIAGGLTIKAGNDIIITHKDHPESPVTVHLGQNYMTNGEANVQIFPSDIIMVTKAGIIYVVGDVSKPGGYVMEDNAKISVLQALAMAGGQTKTAALNKVQILRRTNSNGDVENIPVPLDKIMRGQEKNMTLHAEDILVVPNSGSKEFGKSMSQGFINALTTLMIFRP